MVFSTVSSMVVVTRSSVSLFGSRRVSHQNLSLHLCSSTACRLILRRLSLGALAQVMQRLNLNWFARPTSGVPPKTFYTVFCLTAAFLVCNHALGVAMRAVLPPDTSTTNNGYNPYGTNTINPEDIPTSFYVLYFLQMALSISFGLYFIIITIKTRYYMRKKYAIRAQDCDESIEDCCLSYWCHACVICQMARHTADYDTYSATCCSSTGLGPNAPAIV
jgi:Cys-rich protein (TIGR01571 family)